MEDQHRPETDGRGWNSANGTNLRWFERRPVPVWVILVFALLQMYGVCLVALDAHYFSAIERGVVSPMDAIATLIHPALVLVGATLLFFMRRVAIWLFAAYLLWGVARITLSLPYPNYLGLAVVAGVCIYVLRLRSQNRLK